MDSRQSFPGTGNFDLIDNAFGILMMHNDDVVNPGEGFDMHQHDNAEIVSWIMEGAVRHRDSSGKESVVSGGQSQAISAGAGIRHSEVNAAGYSSRDKLRVIQMWLPPDAEDAPPSQGEAMVLSEGDVLRVTNSSISGLHAPNSPSSPLTQRKTQLSSPGAWQGTLKTSDSPN